jgi:ComF family protein
MMCSPSTFSPSQISRHRRRLGAPYITTMNASPQHPRPALDHDAGESVPPATARLRQWLAAAVRAPRLGGKAAISLMYPPVCAACGASTGEPHGLCARCWSAISFISRPYCERLGTPFAVDLGGRLISPAAMADPPAFDRARAVAAYDDIAREMIHRLKYGDRLELARAMGGLMALSGRELIAEADMIVPVPLHRWRIWTRRFNQAAALAQVIGAAAGKPVAADILRRVKRTRPQVGLSRNERAENLQGALRVVPGSGHRLEGRRVLLVDDVLTTGATANAAARALLRGGASAVDLVTFARVIPGA